MFTFTLAFYLFKQRAQTKYLYFMKSYSSAVLFSWVFCFGLFRLLVLVQIAI